MDTEVDTISGTLQTQLDNLDYYTTGEVDTISGTLQTQIDEKSVVASLLDLVDTPASYDDGLYLKSTASGTEWATASGGSGSSNHSELNELDYASAGHTGFASSVDLSTTSGTLQGQIDGLDYYTTVEVDTISGTLQTQIDGKADTDHTHSTFSGTSVHVDGDATVTGTIYAHAYDSYSPLVLKAGGLTVATASDGTGIVNFPYNPTVDGTDLFVPSSNSIAPIIVETKSNLTTEVLSINWGPNSNCTSGDFHDNHIRSAYPTNNFEGANFYIGAFTGTYRTVFKIKSRYCRSQSII